MHNGRLWLTILLVIGCLAAFPLRGNCADDVRPHCEEIWEMLQKASTKADVGAVISKYQEALKYYKERQDFQGQSEVMCGLGSVHLRQGNYVLAGKFFETARKSARECGNSALQSKSLNGTGLIELFQWRLDEASKLFEQSLSLADQAGDSKNPAAALHCRAIAYRACGDYAQSQQTEQKALDARRTLHDQFGECDSLNNLGAVLLAQSKPDEARDFFEKALAIARPAGYRWGEGWAQFNLANAAWQSKKYDQAIRFGKKALEIAQSLGELRLAAFANNCLGLALMDSGQLDKARGFYDSARSLADQVGLPAVLGWVENNTGYLLFLRQKYDTAQKHLARAMDSAAQNHYPQQFKKARANLTRVYAATGRFDKIVELAARSVPTPQCGKKSPVDTTPCIADMASGNIGAALKCSEEALKRARENHDTSGQLDALTILVMMRYHTGIGKEAEENLQELNKLADAVGDPEQKVMAFGALASILSSLGRKAESQEVRRKLGEAAALITEPQMRITVLAVAGISAYFHEDDKQALTFFGEVFSLAKQTETFSPVIPLIGFCMGRIQLRLGNESGAMSAFQMCVEMARITRNRFAESLALCALADRFRVVGHYQKALSTYGKAQELAEQISYRAGQAQALQGMAEVYEAFGDYDRAIENSKRALALRDGIGDIRSTLYLERELALYHISLNKQDTAAKQLNKVIAKDQEEALGSTSTSALVYLGQLFARQGKAKEAAGRQDEANTDFNEAEIQFNRALEKAKLEVNVEKWAHREVGLFYLDRAKLAAAQSHLSVAHDPAALGKLYLAKQDYKAAREQFDRMLAGPQQRLSVDSVFVANTGLGKVCEGLHDYPQAVTHYRTAMTTVENLRPSGVGANNLRFMSRTIDIFARTEPYKGLARVLFLSSRSEDTLKESLEASEYCKARSLADALAQGISKEGLRADLATEAEKLNARVKAAEEAEVQAMVKNDPQKIEEARTATEKVREALRNHVDTLWSDQQGRRYAMVHYPRPPKLEGADLRVGEAIVVYEVSAQDLFIYVVTKDGTRNVVRGIRKEGQGRTYLRKLVRKFRAPFEFPSSKNLADQEVTFDFDAARELYSVLMLDVIDLLRKTKGWAGQIIVIPDGDLATIPFDALVTSAGGSVVRENGTVKTVDVTFLTDLKEITNISYAQSLTTLTMARAPRESQTRGHGTLLLWYGSKSGAKSKTAQSAPASTLPKQNDKGLPNPSASTKTSEVASQNRVALPSALRFKPLESGKDLAVALKTAFGTGTFAAEENRPPEWFKLDGDQKPLEKENIFIYTHGVFSPELPEPALVVNGNPTYRDDLLLFSDVMASRKLKADFVVIAACQAGLGHYISGEGVMGMSAAMQYSWSNRVLTTLWEVPEYSTLEAMKYLAEYLCVPEANKRLAFELAQKKIRKRWDHPYYWAPFMFVGPPN